MSQVLAPRRLALLLGLAFICVLGISGVARAACTFQITYEDPVANVAVSDASPAYDAAVGFDGGQSLAGTVLTRHTDPETHACVVDESDDPITSYGWAFGDGTTASGASQSHPYGS